MRILICLLFSIVAVDFSTAGCKINLRVENKTDKRISFRQCLSCPSSLRRDGFKVRTRAVPYKAVTRRDWVAKDWQITGILDTQVWVVDPGDTAKDVYRAVLGCNVNRRYRLDFACIEDDYDDATEELEDALDPDKVLYFPGPAKWTRDINVTIPIRNCK